jgi:hypothetical protein
MFAVHGSVSFGLQSVTKGLGCWEAGRLGGQEARKLAGLEAGKLKGFSASRLSAVDIVTYTALYFLT